MPKYTQVDVSEDVPDDDNKSVLTGDIELISDLPVRDITQIQCYNVMELCETPCFIICIFILVVVILSTALSTCIICTRCDYSYVSADSIFDLYVELMDKIATSGYIAIDYRYKLNTLIVDTIYRNTTVTLYAGTFNAGLCSIFDKPTHCVIDNITLP
jgi:hypothetical protein